MNPIRQAIALEYGAHAVPMVTAKGDGAVADMIVEEARKQGVYVSQDPQLLALLSRLNVDDEIPTELYTTVAVILSRVWQVRLISTPRCRLVITRPSRNLISSRE